MKTLQTYKWTILAVIFVGGLLSPLYFVCIYGFESIQEMFHTPPYFFPPHPTLESYREALTNLAPYLLNSLIAALGTLVVTLIVAPPAAFSIAHYLPRRYRTHCHMILLLTQMFPAVMIAIPLFLIFSRFNIVNTRFGLILADSTYSIPFAIIVLSAYFRAIPFELIESALLDGASHLRSFISIVLPVSKGSLATIAIFSFLFGWSDFIYALTLLTSEEKSPVSIGLYLFMGQYGTVWNQLMAGGFIYFLPPLIIILVAGKSVVLGLTSGALKG
ncbi:MAG: carbohydrate ABC transporter permease [bacterium]|nr:carbohydrate ABC transporter permease [bacterium]